MAISSRQTLAHHSGNYYQSLQEPEVVPRDVRCSGAHAYPCNDSPTTARLTPHIGCPRPAACRFVLLVSSIATIILAGWSNSSRPSLFSYIRSCASPPLPTRFCLLHQPYRPGPDRHARPRELYLVAISVAAAFPVPLPLFSVALLQARITIELSACTRSA
ncbi:hypothetical protein C7974DRAFT_2846 [Boeremia exigua]|uniref:uncharacterized protein n=1 Tax=Boeremia exigua TaxID=749465 RepID=UPI001E8CE0BB|nr:uncharacterized protein C7974DRAFT_2846 [Boeremia exigua]KAH6643662.1 hypothetical protein C7974DRAFT_2846 [Boeremia exigua]